jgi:hypothetical protein
MWPYHLERPAETAVAEVMACDVVRQLAHSPFGRICDARLELRGWLQRVVLDTETMTARPERAVYGFDQPLDIRLDCKEEYCGANVRKQGAPPDVKWCLPLVRWLPHHLWMLGKRDIAQAIGGLILDVTAEGARRIGMFSCNRLTAQVLACGNKTRAMAYYQEDPAVLVWTSAWLFEGEQTNIRLL